MPLPFARLATAALGLILPLAASATAQAASHHGRPGHVRTATYQVPPHHPTPHRVHLTSRAIHHHHATLRG